MNWLQALPRASAPAALGSLVSLAAQGFLALALFKLFSPQQVGVFAVTSQIAFFWASLALAQSPLSLLANRQTEPCAEARQAWLQSAWRLLWLAPAAAVAVACSGLDSVGWLAVGAWAMALALSQMTWLLAQSLTLRVGSRWSVAWVRMLPPVLAAVAALWGAWLFKGTDAPVLLCAAVLGYAVGGLWLRPAWQAAAPTTTLPSTDEIDDGQRDPRSARLKMLHALSDGGAATALALSWSAFYGVQEAGWMLALLRILSFVPALVHTAWAQVVLSSAVVIRLRPVHVACFASLLVLLVGSSVQAAVHWGWLASAWQGLTAYVWPLVVWQIAACFMAALAHLPFQKGLAILYSWLCIAINAGLLVLLLGLAGWAELNAHQHVTVLASFMTLSLGALSLFLVKGKARLV